MSAAPASLRALRQAAILASRTACSKRSCPRLPNRALSSRPSSATTPHAQPASSKSPPLSETISTWLWRLFFVSSGAAAAGAAAVYATDPAGTRELARAALDDIEERIRFFTEPSREELLPDAVPAFLGAAPLRTLVIELDTLVHSSYNRQFGWRVAKRPGADAFLAYMSGFYEIVVFTSGHTSYADPILNRLDKDRMYVAYRLYRAETKYEGGVHRKDLAHLNRDLARVVLIDDEPEHFSRQPENAILVPAWEDDVADTALLDLIPFLEGLVQEDAPDVRPEIGALKGRPLCDGLAEWRATAGTRGKAGGRGSLFGVQAGGGGGGGGVAAGGGGKAEGEVESSGGGSWLGQVSPKGSSLFRPAKSAKVAGGEDAGKEDKAGEGKKAEKEG